MNPWGITGTWAPASGTLTLTGVSSVANYQAALRSVTYQNTSEKPSTLTRSVTFTASDGGLTSAGAVRQIAVSSLNDPAVNTVPGTQPGTEDTAVVFSAGNGNQISIADVDAGTAPIQVTLTATNGRLTLAQTSGLAFVSGDGNTDVSMTFTGTIASINSALNGLRFDPNANHNGLASLQIATNDLGNSGTGGAQITNSTVNIDFGSVNDVPVQSVPGAQSTAQNAPLVFSSGTGNAIAISDIDAGGGELRVTLTGANGTLTLGSVAGLSSVLGNGTSVVTITGTLPNLNGALNGLNFTPNFNYSGPASLTVATNDQGNSGSGGAHTDSDVIVITVSPNIVPTITMSVPPLTYAEGAPATPVDAGLNLSDPDNPILDHAQVRIVSGYVQGDDVLSFVNQLGITGSWDAMTGTLLLTGAASPADYRTALRTVAFRNSSDDLSGTRTVSFVVNDGIADSAAATRGITLMPQNDAPLITVPGSQTAREDTPLVFSPGTGNQIAIGDVDAGANPVRLSLLATNGTLNLLQTTGLTFLSGADGTGSMSFSGRVADINAALSGLRFLAAGDYVGPADVQILVDDLGNTGGGPLSASRTVLINVTSVNDAPVGTDGTVTTSEETAHVFSVLEFGFADPKDSPGDLFQAVKIVTLPGGGTLTHNGVPVTPGDFVGVADILAGDLVYTPFGNANGAGYATLGFQVQDSGGTADGGADLDSLVRTLTIDVNAVNDAPVNTVPSGASTPLGTPLTFSSANGNAITVSDIDENGGGLGVTLTATNGTVTLATTAGLLGVTGNGTGSVSFSGSTDDINGALDGLVLTPSAGFFGAGSLQIVTDDLGNTGSPGPLQAMDSIAILVTYAAPSVTTDPAGSLSYVENDPPTAVDSTLSVGAGTLGVLTGAAVEITGNYVNGEDLLDWSAALLPGGVSAVWNAFAGTLTFTGTATLAQYEALLRSVTYENLSDSPDIAPRAVMFRLDDGISTVTDIRQIQVISVNDAPVNSSPGAQAFNQDTTRVFSTGGGNAISVNDIDAGANPVQITLTATHGVLTLSGIVGLTFSTGDGTADASMTFQGTLGAVNTALQGLGYAPNSGYSGSASITLATNDLGSSGTGGALSDADAVSISVLPTGSISGTLLHDVDADADVSEGGTLRFANAVVLIYRDTGNGLPGPEDGGPMYSIATNAAGQFSIGGLMNGTYWVAVNSKSLKAPGYNSGYGDTDVWADQTYGVTGAAQSSGFLAAPGALYGGRDAGASDDASALASSQHMTRVVLTGTAVTGIDSGFSFNAIVNTRGDTTDDDGGATARLQQGSLLQFLLNSNAIFGLQTANFSVGSGAITIAPSAALPAITDAVVLDATSQEGFSGAPIVELDGSGAGAGASGFTLVSGSAGSTVRGFVVNRFGGNLVDIDGSDNNIIAGNYLGTNPTGTADLGSLNSGVLLHAGASGNRIGGTVAADRNVISGNDYAGISIHDAGTDNNLVQGNYIGTGASGSGSIGNGAVGVAIWDGAKGNQIGGAAPGAGNIIANSTRGVIVDANTVAAVENAILGNRIFGNGSLEIDLLPVRESPRTTRATATAARTGCRTSRCLSSAVVNGSQVTVTGTLNSSGRHAVPHRVLRQQHRRFQRARRGGALPRFRGYHDQRVRQRQHQRAADGDRQRGRVRYGHCDAHRCVLCHVLRHLRVRDERHRGARERAARQHDTRPAGRERRHDPGGHRLVGQRRRRQPEHGTAGCGERCAQRQPGRRRYDQRRCQRHRYAHACRHADPDQHRPGEPDLPG